jgi:hypothetical protein
MRVSEDLYVGLKRRAAAEGRSVNEMTGLPISTRRATSFRTTPPST